MDKKKVYVVTKGSYSDYRIVRVFSNPDLAEKFVKASEDDGWETMRVETYDLDDETTLNLNELIWEVTRVVIKKETSYFAYHNSEVKLGDIVWDTEAMVDSYGIKNYENKAKKKGFYLCDSGDLFGIILFAPNKEAALKIANECYFQIMVRNDLVPFEENKWYSFPNFNLIEEDEK